MDDNDNSSQMVQVINNEKYHRAPRRQCWCTGTLIKAILPGKSLTEAGNKKYTNEHLKKCQELIEKLRTYTQQIKQDKSELTILAKFNFI